MFGTVQKKAHGRFPDRQDLFLKVNSHKEEQEEEQISQMLLGEEASGSQLIDNRVLGRQEWDSSLGQKIINIPFIETHATYLTNYFFMPHKNTLLIRCYIPCLTNEGD